MSGDWIDGQNLLSSVVLSVHVDDCIWICIANKLGMANMALLELSHETTEGL